MNIKKIILEKPSYALLVIIAVGLMLYLPALNFDFLINFDDDKLILESANTQTLNWKNLKATFTESVFGLYHPITSLSWAIEKAIYGFNSKWFHLSNILLHLVNALLVFKVSRYFLKKNEQRLFVSLLFVVHPMFVENIVWLSSRKDLMYGFFFLLGLWNYIKYLEVKTWYHYIFMLLFFVLSLFSKSNAVVFPAVLVLFDIYKNKNLKLKYLLNKIHLFVLSGIFIYITVSTQESAGFIRSFEGEYTWLDRILMGLYSLAYYLFRLLIPFDLSPKNLYPTKVNGFLPWFYYLAPLGLTALSYLTYKFRKSQTLLWFGLGFFLIIIAPVLKLIPTGNDIVSNRYAYLPYIGLFIFIAKWLISSNHKAVKWVTFLWVLCLGTYSFIYQNNYKDSISVWSKVIEENAENSWGKAMALNERGQVKMKLGLDQAALTDVNLALSIEPKLPRGLMNKATLLDKMGQSKAALKTLNSLLKDSPELVDGLKLRGVVYGKLNQTEKAIEDFSKAILRSPNNPELYNNRGIAYSIGGNSKLAIKDFTQAIELTPHSSNFLKNRAKLYIQIKEYDKAERDLKQTLVESKEDPNLLYQLANVYYKTNRDAKAESLLSRFKNTPQKASEIGRRLLSDSLAKASIPFFTIAMESKSLHDQSLYQRAQAFKQLNKIESAIKDLNTVVQNVPNGVIFFELANLQFQNKQVEKACENWKKATELNHQSSLKKIKEYCNQ